MRLALATVECQRSRRSGDPLHQDRRRPEAEEVTVVECDRAGDRVPVERGAVGRPQSSTSIASRCRGTRRGGGTPSRPPPRGRRPPTGRRPPGDGRARASLPGHHPRRRGARRTGAEGRRRCDRPAGPAPQPAPRWGRCDRGPRQRARRSNPWTMRRTKILRTARGSSAAIVPGPGQLGARNDRNRWADPISTNPRSSSQSMALTDSRASMNRCQSSATGLRATRSPNRFRPPRR